MGVKVLSDEALISLVTSSPAQLDLIVSWCKCDNVALIYPNLLP